MKFQSTRPRGARLIDAQELQLHALVSIHAPAWGATPNYQVRVPLGLVSIHAPAWGATRVIGQRLGMKQVSIHAPAWGATGH